MEQFLFITTSTFLLAATLTISSISPASAAANETDGEALLAFKEAISGDPFGVLSSWNSTTGFCQWRGVSCGGKGGNRVTDLDLSSLKLSGTVSPSLSNLTFLRHLLLMENSLSGEIPPEFGRLQSLRVLNLSSNALSGTIPANLSHCSSLITIHLAFNQLSGAIPAELGDSPALEALAVDNNNLTSAIPASLGNLSALSQLSFMYNYIGGSLPDALGRLANLSFFQASGNLLTGPIPPSFFNLSGLNYLSVAGNQLQGTLPANIGDTLPNLQLLSFGINNLSGHLPASLANITGLQMISLPQNSFSGEIPASIGALKELAYVNLIGNLVEARDSKGWEFFDSLTNCTQLSFLYLGKNNLQGPLPSSMANLSTAMQEIMIGFTQITGGIPPAIGNLLNLVRFDAAYSLLGGPIPESVGALRSLAWLNLAENGFTGRIPESIGNLTQLNTLYLFDNELEGPLPPSMGNLRNMKDLQLRNNSFNGSLPVELFNLTYISLMVDLSDNLFQGSLPSQVGNFKNLNELRLSGNMISGEIPSSIGECEAMETLFLDRNAFNGGIGDTFAGMKGLLQLNLSGNSLSGEIPSSLSSMKGLQELDLSHNDLSGEVPTKGVFTNASEVSLLGNGGLCGGVPALRLPECRRRSGRSSNHLKVILPVVAGAVILCLLLAAAALFLGLRNRRTVATAAAVQSSLEKFPRVSYADLSRATDGFSPENLEGRGRHGTVYKGSFDGGRTFVAVKVFDLHERGASKVFQAECEALRAVRHRNLVKILTTCSGLDPKGADFKALVFEFMPNGNLEQWLHAGAGEEEGGRRSLSLAQRLSIAVNLADALDYLHNDCRPPVIHCDLKPSNVLLDLDMNACVGDFGLAKFLSGTGKPESSSSIAIRGTVGYVAPEQGAGGKASAAGDVYSYGILMLEMFTGKRPTDGMFGDGVSIREFVDGMVSSGRVEELAGESPAASPPEKECLVSVLEVGLECSEGSPGRRMKTGEAAAKVRAIREAYLAGVGIHDGHKDLHETESPASSKLGGRDKAASSGGEADSYVDADDSK